MDEEVKVCPECSRALVDGTCTNCSKLEADVVAVAEDIKEEVVAEETPKVEATQEPVVDPSENGSTPSPEVASNI